MSDTTLINMQRTDKEKREEAASVDSYKKRKYPYGLCIYLDSDQLTKLGINESLPVGTEVTISAKAIVERTSESAELEPEGDGKERSASLQITDMSVSRSGVSANAANSLYGAD